MGAVLAAKAKRPKAKAQPQYFAVPQHPPGVAPKDNGLAQDEAIGESLTWAAGAVNASMLGAFAEGQTFLGYTELAILAQRPEYRRISETIATQMTRRWIKLQAASGAEDKTDKIKQLEDELKRLNVREVFREAAEQDGFFGRSHVYLDFGNTDDREELKKPIGTGDNDLSKQKIGKGSLKRLRSVEAVWTYPTNYNSNDPLKPDWYRPQQWFVMGKEIHASRLLTFIGREVPDLLKPAYSFGGLSLSQMAKPYVDNWLRTRQSVSDLIEAFSVMVFKTQLPEQINNNEANNIYNRVDLFNELRNNRGTFVVDKNTEDFDNVAAPLGTLDALQAQAQEHMAAVSGIPLVFLLGITPTGLNASSEGEIRAFYDWIHAYQELFFRPNLQKVIAFAQLSLWGEVDPAIGFIFEPLWALDEKGKAEVDKLRAETDSTLFDIGSVTAEDSRRRVAADPESPYAGLKVDELPQPPDEKALRAELKKGRPELAKAA
jgi:phage-related protein (TIGR01555 family)